MVRLRAPGGCPWDREQTFDTIKPYLLEETYEVMDAIDARDWPELTGELGDLLLQSVFFSQMAAEQNLFSIADALDAINEKLIRRHPHVFGEQTAETAGDVRRIWGEIKAAEKNEKKQRGERGGGLLDSVPRALPRWWKRSSLPPAPRSWASIGTMRSKCWASCTKSSPNSTPRAAALRKRNWKASWAICFSSWSTWLVSSRWIPSRRCAKPTPSSANVSVTSSASWANKANRRKRLRSPRWTRFGRNPSDDRAARVDREPPVSGSGGATEDGLGIQRCGTAAGPAVRGGHQGRRPGVRRL